VNYDGLVNLSLLKIQSAPLGNLRESAFDGDEMNIFIPQSIQTQIELEEIADVKRQIISPSSSRTSIGLVQDGLIGSYVLTAPTTKIDWRNALNLLTYTSFTGMKKIEKNKTYTGQELFTNIIPPGINIMSGGIKIKNSVLLEDSRLSKEVLGEKKNFALHQNIWDEYGADQTKTFIDNAQKLANNFNLYNGFTIGYGDLRVNTDILDNITKYYTNKQVNISHMIAEIENNPDMMEKDVFEYKLMNEVGAAVESDIAPLILNNLPNDNNFKIIVSSGAKGSSLNVGQLCGSLGLLKIEGKLAPKKYNNRTLPYFHQNDDRCESRGLVLESFMTGLSFPSFTFLLMVGREGIIEQAIKTADTGYMQRKLIKTMEDVMIKYDYTVRTANETMLQLVYGDSGSDTTKQYQYDVELAGLSNQQLKDKHWFNSSELANYKDYSKYNDNVFEEIKQMRDNYRTYINKAKYEFKAVPTKVWFPVNFTRIIDNVSSNKDLMKGDIVSPSYVYEKLEEILSNKYLTLMAMSKEERNNPKSIKNRDEKIFKTFMRTALYSGLSPKRCSLERKLTKLQFDKIISDITDTYNKSIVQPGEMTGILSAQSLGETITQMTLNTFHAAGLKSMSSTTSGIPRLKEILSYSKSIRTPQLTIHLTEEFNKNKDMAHKIASNLKNTVLADIRGRINVYYDPDPDGENSIMKSDNVKHVFYNQKSSKNSCQSNYKDYPWLMRIEILKEKMLEKEISLLDIKSKFCSWWEKRYLDSKLLRKEEKRVINKITNIAVLSNTDNDEEPVVHIRFNVKEVDKVKDPFNRNMLNEFIDEIIDKFKLKGLDSITNIPFNNTERNIAINKETGEIGFEQQYIINTLGSNLIDIRYINGIDLVKTISNDIYDVYKTFGIEVARTRLIRELHIAYESAGHTVSYTNLCVLVDIMTNSGSIMSIDRHGLNKSEIDVLGRASFESTVEQILTAGLFGEVDNMKGVSSRMIGGLVMKGGTGFCDIVLDTNMVEKSEYSGENKYRSYNEIVNDQIAKHIINNDVEENMFIPM